MESRAEGTKRPEAVNLLSGSVSGGLFPAIYCSPAQFLSHPATSWPVAAGQRELPFGEHLLLGSVGTVYPSHLMGTVLQGGDDHPYFKEWDTEVLAELTRPRS